MPHIVHFVSSMFSLTYFVDDVAIRDDVAIYSQVYIFRSISLLTHVVAIESR
jgi:hypothetical protein